MRLSSLFTARAILTPREGVLVLRGVLWVRLVYGMAALIMIGALVFAGDFPADLQGQRLVGTLLVLAFGALAFWRSFFSVDIVLDREADTLVKVFRFAGLPYLHRVVGPLGDCREVQLLVIPLGIPRTGDHPPRRVLCRLFLKGEGFHLFLEENAQEGGLLQRGRFIAEFLSLPLERTQS